MRKEICFRSGRGEPRMVATSRNRCPEGTSGGPRFRRSNWAVPFCGAALPSAGFTCLLPFLPTISRAFLSVFHYFAQRVADLQFVCANTPPTPLPIYGTVSVGRGARIAVRNGADNSSVWVGLNLSRRSEARWGRPARLKKVGSGAKKPKARRGSTRYRARPRSLKRGERDSKTPVEADEEDEQVLKAPPVDQEAGKTKQKDAAEKSSPSEGKLGGAVKLSLAPPFCPQASPNFVSKPLQEH